MKQDKMQKISQTIQVYLKLSKISRRLHSIDERTCNGVSEITEKSLNTQSKNLMIEANELAAILGVYAYHQSDPRGCALYLVKDITTADSRYNNGIAI